jgi:hypothetical protein
MVDVRFSPITGKEIPRVSADDPPEAQREPRQQPVHHALREPPLPQGREANVSRNDTYQVNVDYHLLEITGYYIAKENKVLNPTSDAYLYFLDAPQNQARLVHRQNYIILLDDVMLDTSLSYSDASAEHGVLPAPGRGHLATYDALPFLNLVYCTGAQWLYQCYVG